MTTLGFERDAPAAAPALYRRDLDGAGRASPATAAWRTTPRSATASARCTPASRATAATRCEPCRGSRGGSPSAPRPASRSCCGPSWSATSTTAMRELLGPDAEASLDADLAAPLLVRARGHDLRRHQRDPAHDRRPSASSACPRAARDWTSSLTEEQYALRDLARDVFAEALPPDRLRELWERRGPRSRGVAQTLADVGLLGLGAVRRTTAARRPTPRRPGRRPRGGWARGGARTPPRDRRHRRPPPRRQPARRALPPGDRRGRRPRHRRPPRGSGVGGGPTPTFAQVVLMAQGGRRRGVRGRVRGAAGRDRGSGAADVRRGRAGRGGAIAGGGGARCGRWRQGRRRRCCAGWRRGCWSSASRTRPRGSSSGSRSGRSRRSSTRSRRCTARWSQPGGATRLAFVERWRATDPAGPAADAAFVAAADAAHLAETIALQVHAGIGFTWEHDLHLWLKRSAALRACVRVRPRRARAPGRGAPGSA